MSLVEANQYFSHTLLNPTQEFPHAAELLILCDGIVSHNWTKITPDPKFEENYNYNII